MSARGRFIVLDGVEGAGKSTQLQTVCDWVTARVGPPVVTREPGGTPLAEAIRELVLADHDEAMPITAELLLMFAARSVHLHNRVCPALDAGQWVVCDRFVDASHAYQGGGQGGDPADIRALEAMVVGPQQPDIVLLLDLPVTRIAERLNQRAGHADRFDRESTAFLERVRTVYQQRAAQVPERYCVIDADQPPADVAAAIRDALETRLA